MADDQIKKFAAHRSLRSVVIVHLHHDCLPRVIGHARINRWHIGGRHCDAQVNHPTRDAAVFAAANPVPEIFPEAAANAGARIVATGRSDFPNQLNNSLVFPGMFRGVLDVRARTISDQMAIAAAKALVAAAREKGLAADRLLPTMGDWTMAARIAGAVGEAAVAEGLARNPLSRGELETLAVVTIGASRACVEQLVKAGLISSLPK